MIGIQSYGAYIPATRLPLGAIGGRRPKEGGPERAVAWNDEDSVTMAVTAALNCLRGFDRSRVDEISVGQAPHDGGVAMIDVDSKQRGPRFFGDPDPEPERRDEGDRASPQSHPRVERFRMSQNLRPPFTASAIGNCAAQPEDRETLFRGGADAGSLHGSINMGPSARF